MEGEFIDLKLPGINLPKVKWPSLNKISLNQVKTKVMELNPENFGTLLNNQFKACEDLWEPILMVKINYKFNIELLIIYLIG